MDPQARKNDELRRYELERDGALAILEYEEENGNLVFTHTFVPEALRGQNIAAILTRFALEDVRNLGKKVVPRCGYTDTFLRRNKDFADLRASDATACAGPACGLPRKRD